MTLNSLDCYTLVTCPADHVRLVVANVTDTARALERSHLCGPIAGLVQAELIGGTVLLGTLLERPEQRISLRVAFPHGLLRGAVLEASYNGNIRGYVKQKVIPELDDDESLDDGMLFERALGHEVSCAIVTSEPPRPDERALFNLNIPERLSITDIIEEYFNSSLQRNAFAQLSAASKGGYVECAHALLCEFLPEADSQLCDRLEPLFINGTIQNALDGGADIATIAQLMGLCTPQHMEVHPIRFACSCTAEHVLSMLRSLPVEEIQALIAENKSADIFCHMCGKCYSITPEQLRTL
ncbi:MAG: Hsp33 family molecular chaperone HslO [Kiritimatiellia bacterium]